MKIFNYFSKSFLLSKQVQGCEKYYGEVDPKTIKKLKGSN